jgi:penicillin G amidase
VTVGVLLALAALVAGALVWRQLPDRATPAIAGLVAPVEVTFDARGIPTIRAHNVNDAMRVEGYLQARERMLQMELGRRVAGGEVSELVGAVALPLDRRQRVFGFAQVADAAAERLPPDERATAAALAAGINAFIDSHPGRWGLEFQLLGVEPRRWTVGDSIRMLLLMQQQLTSTWEVDLQSEALAALPPERRAFLQPTVTAEDVPVLPDAVPAPAPSTAGLLTRAVPPAPASGAPAPTREGAIPPGAPPAPAPSTAGRLTRAISPPSPPSAPSPPHEEAIPPGAPLEVLGIPLEPFAGARATEVGSNSWVVSGAHAARGKPLLASDPHLGFSAPQVWYPLRMELLGDDGRVARWVQGVSLPGLPGLVIFQNDRLAIGLTNTGTDVEDLYREAVVSERVEHIRVKDGPTDVFTVQLGKHGPMVRPGLAVHWAALDPSTLRLPVVPLMLATDWAGLNAGADRFLGPAQNVMYADAAGHIGWRVTGVLPLRGPGDDGTRPMDGADARHDWAGYLPMEQMPRVSDPPSGRIVTANQRAIGTSAGRAWPSSWASPTRARRITELLQGEGLDARRMREIQLDTVGTVHREVVERLRPFLDSKLAAAFAGWDGRADPHGVLFRAAEEMRRRAYLAVVNAALRGTSVPATELDWYNNDATLLSALRATSAAWQRAGLGDRDTVLRTAVQAVRLDGPTWGERNRLDIAHPFGRSGGLLGFLFNPPSPGLAGCDRCVRVATPHFGQSMRLVVDFADPEATTLVLPLGVSGHLGSAHRQDAMEDWLTGDLDGTRTRLHAPPVGPPLVFRP